MTYFSVPDAYYQEFQPGTPWHQGARGWSTAPVPGWGANPNLVGPPRLAVHGCTACGQESSTSKLAILGVVALLGVGAWLVLRKPKPQSYSTNRRVSYRTNKCRGRGGPYLLPEKKKYPVPSLRCAHTALTYAGWPNNLDDAPAVLRGMKKTEWADDPSVRQQMRELARVYEEETGRAAPPV